MKKAGFAIMALAVCVMMVAPVVMAGKPSGGGKYSTIQPTSGSSNGISAGPTQGQWLAGSGWHRWFVAEGPSQNNNIGPGGPINIYEPLSSFGNSIYSSTHGEWFWIWDNVKKTYLNPSQLSQKTYYLPSTLEVHLWILMVGITNPHAGQPGQHPTITLTLILDTSKLPSGQQVALTIGARQLTLSGTDVEFHYDDMHQTIDWNSPRYGFASHSFTFTIDI